MKEREYCPHCQRKNDDAATHCAYCGFPLAGQAPTGFPTENVHVKPGSVSQNCDEIINRLPEGAVAFKVEGVDEPVIVPDAGSIILGRSDTTVGVGYINLLTYSELAMAISRQHCRFALVDGRYTLEDLDSTNGTWLNRRRLVPGVVNPVLNGDRIWLGPLKLIVCFHDKQLTAVEPIRQIEVVLRPRSAPEAGNALFTPNDLVQYIGPFLQAVEALDRLLRSFQHKPPQEVRIYSIQQENGEVSIRLTGAETAIQVIQQLVNPWWDEMIGVTANTPSNLTRKLLTGPIQLAEDVVKRTVPDVEEAKFAAYVKKLLPAIHTLTDSPLILRDSIPQEE